MAQIEVIIANCVKTILHTVKYFSQDKKLCLVTIGRTKLKVLIYRRTTLRP